MVNVILRVRFMEIEYEATFPNINKEEIRERLQESGAVLVRPEYTQRRKVYHLPEGHEIRGGWMRVRDEGDKIMITLKVVDGEKIENQKEINVKVTDFEAACDLVATLGCREKAYQVNINKDEPIKCVGDEIEDGHDNSSQSTAVTK